MTNGVAPDRAAMQELAVEWTRAQPIVAAFIASVVPGYHDAEDVLQRTAASLVSKFEQFDRQKPFTAWSIGVARIEVLRFRQECGRDRLVFDDEAVATIAETYGESEPQLREMNEVIVHCLKQLRGRLRDIMEVFSTTDVTAEQVGQRLGLTRNAVLVALHRGRRFVRDCISTRMAERNAGT
jgi:RNA polymerase sigma-70 factor (ECF subfamily)